MTYAIAHCAFRLIPDFATVPRFARRWSTMSTRPRLLSLNAISPVGISFACRTAEHNMTLLILAYLAGILTIHSPCILPVLPFVFARADQPFLRTGLPLLLGMAVAFMGVATLASVGGGWAVETNQYGRLAALALLALFAMTSFVGATRRRRASIRSP